ncbi:MAG: Asp-tRNA(Asn)/Glu-tRNA(Gln) amidotransferase subunit GatC, partial [Pseudomonadota bacterium]
LSQLAKLDLSEDASVKLQSSLNDILEMVGRIQSADTEQIAPLSNPLDAHQILRDDEVTEINQRDALLRNAPDTQDGLFLVPQVIE